MATREQIRKILVSDEFTTGEKFVVRAQFRESSPMGNFEEKLWEILCCADTDNLKRIGQAFPEEFDAFLSWRLGGLGDRLRAAGLEI